MQCKSFELYPSFACTSDCIINFIINQRVTEGGLFEPFKCEGAVEDWLNGLVEAIKLEIILL